MRLKSKIEKPAHVTREEFDALSQQFESFKEITALALHAITVAIKSAPGMPDSNARRRLEKLGAFADLEPAESAELKALLTRLDSAARIESQREFDENAERSRPKRGEDFRVPSWRG